MSRFWEGRRQSEVDLGPSGAGSGHHKIATQHIHEQAYRLIPQDRFVDVSWAEFRALCQEKLTKLPLGLAFEIDVVGERGVMLADHVYARPRDLAPPCDPALVSEARSLVIAAEALLRKVNGL